MRSVLLLVLIALTAVGTASNKCHHRDSHKHHTSAKSTIKSGTTSTSKTSWNQPQSGIATFTRYDNCQNPSCGWYAQGYTAAINLRSFGAWVNAGGNCGRCYKISPSYDPYSPKSELHANSIVVKITDLCPITVNPSKDDPKWCSQTTAEPHNIFGGPVHFDLCNDTSSGAAQEFFDDEYWLSRNTRRGAMSGTFEECVCKDCWKGSVTHSLWGGSCMANDAALLPDTTGACPNVGIPP